MALCAVCGAAGDVVRLRIEGSLFTSLHTLLQWLQAFQCSAAEGHQRCRGSMVAMLAASPHALHPCVSCALLSHPIADAVTGQHMFLHPWCGRGLYATLSGLDAPRYERVRVPRGRGNVVMRRADSDLVVHVCSMMRRLAELQDATDVCSACEFPVRPSACLCARARAPSARCSPPPPAPPVV